MSINFYLQTSVLPKLKSIVKSVIKRPANLDISVKDFISLWGPQKISTFVSIGSNDGVKNDPLADYITAYQWKGIMVEPSPFNFEKLKRNIGGNKHIILENIGIGDEEGTFDFYYLKDIKDNEPDWYDQVCSFDKNAFYKNISVEKGLLQRTAISKIDIITFNQLLDKHQFSEIDILMIDTEGYDYKILSSINFDKYKPKIIIFEYEWLTNYDFKAAVVLLRKSNYRIIFNGFDCIAF